MYVHVVRVVMTAPPSTSHFRTALVDFRDSRLPSGTLWPLSFSKGSSPVLAFPLSLTTTGTSFTLRLAPGIYSPEANASGSSTAPGSGTLRLVGTSAATMISPPWE